MISAIILAAGNSSRFISKKPKQFQKLNGKLLIDYSISTFSNCKEINQIIIVVPQIYFEKIKKMYPMHTIVVGGKTRKESSYKGLLACPNTTKKVLIHDSARIFVDDLIIKKCLKNLDKSDAVSTAVPTKDTIAKVKNEIIEELPDRSQMYLEQTPQGFNYEMILNAHKKITINVTDDIKLAKELGVQCSIVIGSEKNFKITTQLDFKLAKIILKDEI